MSKFLGKLLLRLRSALANMGLIVLAEPVSLRENLWRVYCPRCKQWHLAYLSGHPGSEHFHLPCGLVIPYVAKRRGMLIFSIKINRKPLDNL